MMIARLSLILRVLGVLGALGLTSLAGLANAKPEPGPLNPLPMDKVQNLGPLLRNADVSLLEANDKDHIKQLSTITFIPAPPQTVREIVIHPEKYGDFVRNMDYSRIKPSPAGSPPGSVDHEYKLSYKFYTVDGRHRYVILPAVPGHGAAPVEMYDPDDNGTRHFRWEFYPAPGGTIVALYGFAEIPLDGFLTDYMKRAPPLEFGFGLITQWTLLLAMKQRAIEITPQQALPPPVGNSSIEFMLGRGTLAIFRIRNGLLQEVDLISNVKAPAATTLALAATPQNWNQYVPSISKSADLGSQDNWPTVEIEQSLPLLSWKTRFALRQTPKSVDMLGIDGDLRQARIRWDATDLGGGSSQLVLRTDEPFERSSMVLRQLYKLEPLFKYGVNVGLSLVLLRSVERRATAMTQATNPANQAKR